ncbi:hypothetical protein F4811DRAFT_548995 [Daldinia bambusicola]|nr:hypothetical protein F4811DRAFT_548995 [Daldinia bambusicola]
MDSNLGDLESQLEHFEFRMEDFDPQDEDFDFDVGDWDFSMEAMNSQLPEDDYFIDDIDKLLEDFYNNPDSGLDNQSRQDGVIEKTPEGDANVSSSPGSQAFIDRYEWTQNNLPVGVSFNSDLPAATPGFMHGWTYVPEEPAEDTKKPKDEDQVIFMSSRGTGYRAEMVPAANATEKKPEVRRSSRRTIAPRIPFPTPRPAWTMLATDFRNVSTIPKDISLWCPCCTRIRPNVCFKRTPWSYAPVETCMDCRKGQMIPLKETAICWSSPSDYHGCGRLLPRANFSGIHDLKAFTGILCHDCRAFGPDRVRFEGRHREVGA